VYLLPLPGPCPTTRTDQASSADGNYARGVALQSPLTEPGIHGQSKKSAPTRTHCMNRLSDIVETAKRHFPPPPDPRKRPVAPFWHPFTCRLQDRDDHARRLPDAAETRVFGVGLPFHVPQNVLYIARACVIREEHGQSSACARDKKFSLYCVSLFLHMSCSE